MIGTVSVVSLPNEDSFTLTLPRGACYIAHSVETDHERGTEKPVIRIAHTVGAEEVPVKFFMFRDGGEIPGSLMETTDHICSWVRSLFGKEEARHLFVQFDPTNNNWALGLMLGKQLAPSTPEPEPEPDEEPE